MGIVIRKAILADIPAIMSIIPLARKCMEETGNTQQWINGYPQESVIRSDIEKEYGYLLCSSVGEVVGYFYFAIEEDATYSYIEGKWLNNEPYGVVHRLAANGKAKGLASHCLNWCFSQCSNLRVDTHEKNVIIRHILEKEGFSYCGTIYVSNGTPRRAYQKKKV